MKNNNSLTTQLKRVILQEELTADFIKTSTKEQLINRKFEVFEFLATAQNKVFAVEFLKYEENKDFAVEFLKDEENKDFAVEFLKDEENKDFAVEFLATNHETAIALMEINNEVLSESNAQSLLLQQLSIQNNQIVQNEERLQNNEIANLIKDNFNDFLTKFFTVETTDERKNSLKKILEIKDIDVANIQTLQEENSKKRFIETFLTFFNENLIKEKATTIIKNNLFDFTEQLLEIENFEQKRIALFANASSDVISKITNVIANKNIEEHVNVNKNNKPNATAIVLNNPSALEEVLETANIANNIKITEETVLSEEVAKKLSYLATQQAENNKKTNAKTLIVKGIKAEKETIIKNLTAEAIETLELEQIKALGSKVNILNKAQDIATTLNNSENLKVKSLARKIAYQEPEKYKQILEDDFALSKQLNKTLTGTENSVINKDNLATIRTSSSAESTILKYNDRQNNLARSEITAENQIKMSSIKLGLVNATQKSANNNDDDTKKLKTTLETASSLMKNAGKDGKGDKQITAKDITDSAVDFNRDRLKLLGFHRKVENGAYAGYEVDVDGEKAIKEFKELEIIKSLYKGQKSKSPEKENPFSGKEKDKWTVKLAFIEFMGYKTPEELSFLKIVDEDNNSKNKQNKIEAILKEIKDNFGWTLETDYDSKKEMKLEYKEPDKNNEIFKNFVKQSIDFLKIAEEAEKAEKGKKPEETLKGSLQVKKVHLNELAK